MAQEHVRTASEDDIRSIRSHFTENGGPEVKLSDDVAANNTKKKPRSGRTSKKETAEQRMDKFEACSKKMDEKFDLVIDLLRQQDVGTRVRQNPAIISNSGPSGEHSEHRKRGPSGQHTPDSDIECLDGDSAIARHSDIDEISLAPGQHERRDLLGMLSDRDDNTSVSSFHLRESRKKTERFDKYVQPVQHESISEETGNVLKDLFGEDVNQDDTSKSGGLILDQAQIDILSKSWRLNDPERLSCFKDEYKSFFPVHEQSKDALQVPTLDDLLEPLISKKHGARAVSNWNKSRKLFTQPLRSVENLAYSGQMAARMGIISVSYMQQALGTLLNKLKEKDVKVDDSIQTVRDIFSMSTKALDQVGRTGAFHHMIRRKAAVTESGLNNIKDVQEKILYLPLAGDGVFGSALSSQLKQRKERNDQLNDLLPEFASKPKQQRSNNSQDRGRKRSYASTSMAGGYNANFDDRKRGRGDYNVNDNSRQNSSSRYNTPNRSVEYRSPLQPRAPEQSDRGRRGKFPGSFRGRGGKR